MNVVIYQSFIIHIFVLFYGVYTLSVEINGNVTGFLGENGTEIECSYTQENVISITSVTFLAFTRTNINFIAIALFAPNGLSYLADGGQYLKGRVTLTKSTTGAVITFNKLMCIDETRYQCKVNYITSGGVDDTTSNDTSISVNVLPSKPDSVLIVHTPADSSSSTTKHVAYSTSLLSSAITSTSSHTETLSTVQIEKQNDTTLFNNSTLPTTNHNSLNSTPSNDDVFSETTYEATTYSLQQTTTPQDIITEGDNITVVCTGVVGKPPAEHLFQKYRSGHTLFMTYTPTETSISAISENCSYYRTSNLTFQVTAEDNNAVIRCAVNSSMAGTDMFVETKPIKVYYEVSMPTITKYPNDSYYIVDEATSINLTCKSDGNPKPNYRWYKENENEPVSTSANWTITDINVTNSGVYTCNVSNTFNGKTHRNAKHVHINIMNKDDIPTTQSSSTCSTSCVGKKEETSTEKLDDIPTTQSSSNCRSACVDKKEENSKGNLVLVAGIVGAVVAVVIVIIVIIACTCRRRKNKSPAFTNVSNSFGDSKPKPVTELRTGDYDYIALEDDPPKTKSSNDGLEVEDINKHNEEYLKKQEEEEKKKNESKTPPQPAVYAQVNEATKSKNKLKTETQETANKQEEDTYAESQEGIYDKAGDRRHIENENVEHFDSSMNSSKQNSNGDNKLSIQTSQVGSYANQGFEKDENRKVATVSPTVRSSTGSQNDEQTNSNRNSQSKKGYENIIGTDQTGISVEESSHRTAL